eukprot:2245448-Pleurochrysis_carterae.AAC.1
MGRGSARQDEVGKRSRHHFRVASWCSWYVQCPGWQDTQCQARKASTAIRHSACNKRAIFTNSVASTEVSQLSTHFLKHSCPSQP